MTQLCVKQLGSTNYMSNNEQIWIDKENRTSDRISWEAAKNNAARLLANKTYIWEDFVKLANKLYQLEPEVSRYQFQPKDVSPVKNGATRGGYGVKGKYNPSSMKGKPVTPAQARVLTGYFTKEEIEKMDRLDASNEIDLLPRNLKGNQFYQTRQQNNFEPNDFVEEDYDSLPTDNE